MTDCFRITKISFTSPLSFSKHRIWLILDRLQFKNKLNQKGKHYFSGLTFKSQVPKRNDATWKSSPLREKSREEAPNMMLSFW